MKLRTRGLVVAVALATAAGAFVAAPSQAASAARTVTIWSGANDAKSDNQTPITYFAWPRDTRASGTSYRWSRVFIANRS